MSRILILGGGGMLGHKLCHELSGDGHEVFATVRDKANSYREYAEVFAGTTLLEGVDVLDESALLEALNRSSPEVVVNAVGIVKQLPAAQNRLISVAVNSYLPHRLALCCRQRQCKLIHISTDCVFSGRHGGYTEQSPSDAEDVYGKSKFLGETDASQPSALTLRTSFIGRELHRPTHGLVEWFLAQKGRVKGFRKALYTGLTSRELCRVISLVIEKHRDLAGVYQVASETINKYDLLMLIRKVYGLDIEIEPQDDFVCDRSMSAEAFTKATGYSAPAWAAMIEDMHDDPLPYSSWHC
jgi:dTDP-4-dehydrorhamnose reductase